MPINSNVGKSDKLTQLCCSNEGAESAVRSPSLSLEYWKVEFNGTLPVYPFPTHTGANVATSPRIKSQLYCGCYIDKTQKSEVKRNHKPKNQMYR